MGLYKMWVFISFGRVTYQLMIRKCGKKSTSIVFRFCIIYMKALWQLTLQESRRDCITKSFLRQDIVSDWNLWWGWIDLSVGWGFFVSFLEESRGRRRSKGELRQEFVSIFKELTHRNQVHLALVFQLEDEDKIWNHWGQNRARAREAKPIVSKYVSKYRIV